MGGRALQLNTVTLTGWKQSVAVFMDWHVAGLVFLGFSAGLPFLLVFSTMSAWLTDYSVSRTTIGFFSWIGILYSIKVVWAPVVDRVRLPFFCHLGQRRGWMLIAQIGIAFGLIGLAMVDPSQDLQLIALLGLLVAFSSATQDVVIDAYRIEIADSEKQAALAGAYIFGYRLALLVAGAGALYLADFFSWSVAYFVMAALVSVGIVTTCVVVEPKKVPLDPATDKAMAPLNLGVNRIADAVVQPFKEFFQRNGWLAIVLLALIATYRISDITMGVMANPFYLDLGFTKTEIANVVKVFGFWMTLSGSFLAGIFVVRYGLSRMLLLGAVMVALTNFLFAWMAELEPSIAILTLVVSADNLSGGMANVVFIAFLSYLTNRSYTATQYAMFSSLMTLLGKFVGGFAGVVVDLFDYTTFFVYAAGLGLPAIALVIICMRLGLIVEKESRSRTPTESS